MFNKSSAQKRIQEHKRCKNTMLQTVGSIKAAFGSAKERIISIKAMILQTLCSIKATPRSATTTHCNE
jgi:hypothetical protein